MPSITLPKVVGMTVRQAATLALKLLSVVSEGNPPTDEQLNDAVNVINWNIDAWNADGSIVFALKQNITQLTTLKQIYQIGPVSPINAYTTPDIIVPLRPLKLYSANFTYLSQPQLELPMYILSAEEWADIRVKQIYTTISNKVYLDEQYPVGNIYMWPIPTNTFTLVLWYWDGLNSNCTLDTVLQYPPGYEKAIIYDMAINLAPMFNREDKIPVLSAIYEGVKTKIAENNLRSRQLQYRGEAQGTTVEGTYNVLDDNVYGGP